MHILFLLAPLSLLPATANGYDLVDDYAGLTFFDQWDFYGNFDNLTLGDVWWLDRDDAYSQGLAFIDSNNRAVLKVDNMHSVSAGQKRNAVRIMTQKTYGVGSLWIIDLHHIPFGCSVWPAFWTLGPDWPNNGEIDIIESINLRTNNQAALHTKAGCMKSDPPSQIGQSVEPDCSQPSGCQVQELQANSFGQGFADAGGGVWATQFDVSGIYIWFWSRNNVPASISQANTSSSITDLASWGRPSAAYPATSCNITNFFSPQNLVLDITLCGKWAGLPENYLNECGSVGTTGVCYNDAVVGDGSKFNNAYFEIDYIRAYTTGGSVPTPTATGNVAVATNSISPPAPKPSTVPATTSPAGTALIPSPLFFPGGEGRMANAREAVVGALGVVIMTVAGMLCDIHW